MKNLKCLLSMILALAMVFSMAACTAGSGESEETGAAGEEAGEQTGYSVTVKSAGGMALAGVDVYVYADSTLADLKQYGETDENGKVSFQMPAGGDYAIVLSGTPKGYQVESSYSFSGSSADITLTSSLIKDESLAGATLGLGDVMYDFSVVTPDGTTVTLSDVLAEKKMVLLNFWYTTCTWCITEFPFMEQAYQQYIDEVGIIAVDPFDQNPAIEAFQAQQGLTFPMASCPASWATAFGVSGYPTSVIIDRYGVICVVEAGGITSLRPFISAFEHFTAEDYQQEIFEEGIGELVTDVKPTYTMATSEEVAAVMNSGEIDVTYRPETEDDSAEFSWPFIITEKNGEACLKASNQEIESSFAILYADVYLKEGQAVGFDYLASCERGADVMVVIVNDQDVYQISGVSETEEWSSCYPWVAEEEGYYEVALCYLKDESENAGDDTVYIKNMRVVDSSEIDVATFIPREAASTEDGFEFEYVEVVLNENDGYYHVGNENGPLLLVDMMNYTQFSEERTLWDIVYNGDADVDGRNMYEEMLSYFSYASNSSLNGVCTVNAELAEQLKTVASVAGFDGTEGEWLKMCSYYQVYGSGDAQLEDPIKGLAPYSAYQAKLGKNVESNYFYYDRAIIPRGLLAEFVPTMSGVYRITSRADSEAGVDAWIFDEDRNELLVYQMDERLWNDSENVSMVFYMEAGRKYYIDIAFWDMYEVGYIPYDIEYVAPTLQHFRLAAPGYFTYDSDATGDAMYYLISGGIDVVLGEDGKYYEDLGLDENGKQLYGSLLYCDFTGVTALFSNPIATVDAYDENGNVVRDENGNTVKVKGMIDMGGFDFSKTEDDLYILGIMAQHDNDPEATDAYLKELWGADYDAYAEIYQLKDVYEGRFHGEGEDLTEEMRGYLSQIITTGGKERQGCVVVDQRLAEILQMLMDKYTFANVDHAWTKLCYYYDYLGPEG